jgi:hypothetical protein
MSKRFYLVLPIRPFLGLLYFGSSCNYTLGIALKDVVYIGMYCVY